MSNKTLVETAIYRVLRVLSNELLFSPQSLIPSPQSPLPNPQPLMKQIFSQNA
ncbi:MAG: hypothetical protein V7L11_21400 [Nostoc sp.]|uniref:hypothetical protein n=1 Tax=Nostoc sp. TaxID=1180 RepID=UPI002FF6768F